MVSSALRIKSTLLAREALSAYQTSHHLSQFGLSDSLEAKRFLTSEPHSISATWMASPGFSVSCFSWPFQVTVSLLQWGLSWSMHLSKLPFSPFGPPHCCFLAFCRHSSAFTFSLVCRLSMLSEYGRSYVCTNFNINCPAAPMPLPFPSAYLPGFQQPALAFLCLKTLSFGG